MFGYIVLNKPEVKFKDFDMYCSFYCGLCQSLKERHGFTGQLSLTYDLTFVVLLLTGLHEPKILVEDKRCLVHPVHKRRMRRSELTDYAADMNVLLSYYKCVDDWNDEKQISKLAYSGLLKKSCRQIEARYPEKAACIQHYLTQLSEYEKQNERNLDTMAGCFGKIMEEIVAYGDPVWESSLRRVGFFLGKFIYLLDAYDDIEDDLKESNYNPFSEMYGEEDFDNKVRQILLMMMSECCAEFEKLPILEYIDLLRNILYSGVWIRFSEICSKRNKEQEIEND